MAHLECSNVPMLQCYNVRGISMFVFSAFLSFLSARMYVHYFSPPFLYVFSCTYRYISSRMCIFLFPCTPFFFPCRSVMFSPISSVFFEIPLFCLILVNYPLKNHYFFYFFLKNIWSVSKKCVLLHPLSPRNLGLGAFRERVL